MRPSEILYDYTLLGGSSFAKFCQQEFGKFPRLVGRYCSYLLPKQAGGTTQILSRAVVRFRSWQNMGFIHTNTNGRRALTEYIEVARVESQTVCPCRICRQYFLETSFEFADLAPHCCSI